MILFAVFVMLSLQGVWADSFYLLDDNQQVTTSGFGLLMYSGGTVCDDGLSDSYLTDKTADWICRMMGYASLDYLTSGDKYTWQENYPITLDNVRCSGSVVPYCEYDTSHNCGHNEDVWLSCNMRTQRGDLNSFYLLDDTELFTQSGHGLLMYQGGTVSYEGFDDTTANWICRFMGYEKAADWVNDRQFSFQDHLPIKLNNLVCSTTSYTDILPSCQSRIRTADDSHDEDIWIWCNSVVIAECPAGYKVKLENKLCQECPPTTYSPIPNIDFTCLHCPEGSSSPAASPYCTCVGGSYLSADYSSCQACPTETASKEGSMSSGQCVLCPEGTISIDDGKACSCNKGYGWLWTSAEEGTCSPCPVNSFKLKTQGICRQCPVEATSLPLSEQCICAEGLAWNGEGCVNCVAEKSEDNVCGCDAGTFWSTYSNTCEECPKNHYSQKYSESCSKCPVYTVSIPESTECHPCPNGLFWKDFDCVECPNLHIGNGAYFVRCPEGTSPSEDKTMCQKSSTIYILSVTSPILSLLAIVLILSLVIWFKITSRNISNLKLSYSPEPSGGTLQLSGRKCMCPDCPCSARPALPPRESVIQDDDLYMNH